MKKIVLKFGLISGAIIAVLMLATLPFVNQIGFDYSMVVGYTTMLLAFVMIFVGIRSYRDTVLNGYISFKRGLAIGLLITLISTLCYVITWEIVYYNFLPDFADQYANHLTQKLQNSGATSEQIAQKREEIKQMKVILENPIYNGLIAFTEPLPVGLVISLFSAWILRRKPKDSEAQDQLGGETAPAGSGV
jgi:Protein of unknown function (DUF4199)